MQPGGLCLWGGQGQGSVFLGRSSGAALELLSGDSDSAGRWRWSLSPDNIIFHGPSGVWRGLEHRGDSVAHLCQGCDPHAWLLPIPRAPLPGQSLAGAPGQLPGSGSGTALGSQSSCPRPAVPRGKIYRLSEPGPEVSRGQKVHFSEVTVHFFQSNEAIICESGRCAGASLEAERGTAAGAERTGRSPLPFAICHSTGLENKYTTHRNVPQGRPCCGLGRGMGWEGMEVPWCGCKVTEDGQKSGMLPVNNDGKMPLGLLVTPVRQEGAAGGSWCRVWIVF